MTTTQQTSVSTHLIPTQEERVIDTMLQAWDKDQNKLTRSELAELTGLKPAQISRVISKLRKHDQIDQISLSDDPFDKAYALTSDVLVQYRPNGKDHRRKPRMRLTIEQQEILAKTTAEILTSRPACEFWDAADEAQRALPEDRRRPFERLKAPNVKKWLVPMVEEAKKELRDEEPETPVEPVTVQETNLKDISLEDLVREVGSRLAVDIAEEVTTRVRSALSRDLTNALRKIEEEYHGQTPHTDTTQVVKVGEGIVKPKVLVVGLLPQQQKEIEREFGEFVDLRFHKSEKGSTDSNIPNMASDVDVAIAMTKFISHSEEKLIRKGVTGDFRRVPGGVSSLKSVMHSFYNRWSESH